MKRTNLLLVSVIVIVGLFGLAAFFMSSSKPEEQQIARVPNEKLTKDYSPRLGNSMAKVTIVEFLDPECEACAAFYPTVKGIVNDYKVQFVVRYMLFHGSSEVAAMATEAAGKQGKYWEMQGQLFHRAKEWSHRDTPPVEVFEKIAGELGIDIKKFREDIKDPQTLANITADYQEGPSIGVKGTPTIFVNGRILTELSYSALKGLVEEELKK